MFFLLSAVLGAQERGVIMIPRTAYVGDPVTMVVPLPAAQEGANDIIITADALSRILPSGQNVDFHRIVVEHRVSGGRLLIEFTAFTPGILELPEFEIGGVKFSGLTASISSVFEKNAFAPELAGAASTLAMPGTALLIYAAMTVFAVTILLTIWFIFKGRFYIKILKEKWRRQRLFANMKNTGRRLRKNLQKDGNKRAVLDIISEELRIFLSVLTEENCRSMTSREFLNISAQTVITDEYDLNFLVKFFKSCDDLRFSGSNFNSGDVLYLLNDLQLYLDSLEKFKKEKNRISGAAQEKAA
jgi:hypothetical protein